jgi:hypothetical protein
VDRQGLGRERRPGKQKLGKKKASPGRGSLGK